MAAHDQLFPVPFHGDTVVLVSHNDQPYVAMRTIAVNMGLDWAGQFTKICEKFKSTVEEIPTVADDGRLREMTCIPLRKLPAWLYSINPNKVAPELREKVVAYQEECDEALWDYWTQGSANNPRVKSRRSPGSDRVADLDKARRLCNDWADARDPARKVLLASYLEAMHAHLGLPPPPPAPPISEASPPRPPAMWLWMLKTLLDEITLGRLAPPHALDMIDGRAALIFLPGDFERHLRAHPALQTEWQQRGGMRARAFKQVLAEHHLWLPGEYERHMDGRRRGHLLALDLDAARAVLARSTHIVEVSHA
ncbi:phage antirepressor N-terminal domain-containing protein [Chitinimonas sp.]|uniref:phage antirepressor N-terminal domain-containing protein n=1 Tax=Chitinimonas sp. TaxID=1934313 RepID=UPI0035B35134